MKRYYVSRIDHTEVINVTTDPEQLQKARQRLVDLEMLDSDGTVHKAELEELAVKISEHFFTRLQRRFRFPPLDPATVTYTMEALCLREEYYGLFLYMAFLYGLLGWHVPEKVSLLPAIPDALAIFCTHMTANFRTYLISPPGNKKEVTDDAADAS